DSVTEKTWADLWLSEGFATYFAGLFLERYEGEAVFREYMRDAAQRYFAYEKHRNAPIHDTQSSDLMRLLNENNYEKGSWVLHMLRKRLGDEAFFRGIRNFYNNHREGNATSEDLRAEFEKAAGKNLKEFFARWVYGAGHPRYQVQTKTLGRTLLIQVAQLQADPAFLDPLPVEITVAGNKLTRIISPKSKVATLRLPLKGKFS